MAVWYDMTCLLVSYTHLKRGWPTSIRLSWSTAHAQKHKEEMRLAKKKKNEKIRTHKCILYYYKTHPRYKVHNKFSLREISLFHIFLYFLTLAYLFFCLVASILPVSNVHLISEIAMSRISFFVSFLLICLLQKIQYPWFWGAFLWNWLKELRILQEIKYFLEHVIPICGNMVVVFF